MIEYHHIISDLSVCRVNLRKEIGSFITFLLPVQTQVPHTLRKFLMFRVIRLIRLIRLRGLVPSIPISLVY